jgi:hypothetical protein
LGAKSAGSPHRIERLRDAKNMTFPPKTGHRPLLAAVLCLLLPAAWAQRYPITPAQSATAHQVAQAGVPLSELAPDAPDTYTVRSGDTLWDISSIFLRSPWRWPELWGMNLQEIRNPHLIYPGQQLVLLRQDGRAMLRLAGSNSSLPTVRLTPRMRVESRSSALPTLDPRVIEPFLAEPLIVEEGELAAAPRLVATTENRMLLTRGDRAYARSPADASLLEPGDKPRRFRLFRNGRPLKDPDTAEVLGYEAQFVGKATLVRGESMQEVTDGKGSTVSALVPATLDITEAKEEMLVGDRLQPEPERGFMSYVPHVPAESIAGRIVSVYGSAVVNAAQNQVVVINRGRRDGLESGHVLFILKDGRRIVDKTDPAQPELKLPDERNGLLMVFRTFDKLSYGLVLDTTDGVKVGDRLVSPR